MYIWMFLTPSLDLVLSKVMQRRCRNSGFLECSTLDIRHSQNSGTEDCLQGSGVHSDVGLLARLTYSSILLPCLVTPSSSFFSNSHLSPISSTYLFLTLPSLVFPLSSSPTHPSLLILLFPPTLSLPHLPLHPPIPSFPHFLLHLPSPPTPSPLFPTSHILPPTSHTLPQGQ